MASSSSIEIKINQALLDEIKQLQTDLEEARREAEKWRDIWRNIWRKPNGDVYPLPWETLNPQAIPDKMQ